LTLANHHIIFRQTRIFDKCQFHAISLAAYTVTA